MAQHSINKTFEAFLNTTLTNEVSKIDVDEVDTQNMILLDTRTKEEYELSHLKNAIWIGYDAFDLKKLDGISTDENIVVYCSIGVRSGKIGKELQKADYKNVKNLYGGIFEWYNRGNAVYNKQGVTNDIHTYNFMWSVWVNKRN